MDWGTEQFLMIDNCGTKRPEDGIAALPAREGTPNTAVDLRVVFALAVNNPPSLMPNLNQICLGINNLVLPNGESATPAINLVRVNKLIPLKTDQAEAFLGQRGQSVVKKGRGKISPAEKTALANHLRRAQDVASRIESSSRPSPNLDTVVNILMACSQRAAVAASRSLSKPPPLIVLRCAMPRNEDSANPPKYKTQTPTLLLPGDNYSECDAARLKSCTKSGEINWLQLACALLGVDPLSEALVQSAVMETSKSDRDKNLKLPAATAKAISDKKSAIREVLKGLANS
jgi:hypothetical protein